jgi:hypothetical protein
MAGRPGGRAGWVEFLAGSSKQMEIKYFSIALVLDLDLDFKISILVLPSGNALN